CARGWPFYAMDYW
nr:immunoglobulin heavy chain junction region [Mus musculus]MBK4198610.1 immunoglobulin heavy chain junction region [Mus musculus]